MHIYLYVLILFSLNFWSEGWGGEKIWESKNVQLQKGRDKFDISTWVRGEWGFVLDPFGGGGVHAWLGPFQKILN